MDKLKYVKIENEDGSLSDNIPLGVDAENVDTNDGSTVEIELNNLKNKDSSQDNSINNLKNQINSLASGSPLVASSVSEMTDTSKVYVNTTDGNWYYYNGSSWEIGGVYQATEGYDEEIQKFNKYLDEYLGVKLNPGEITMGKYINGKNGVLQGFSDTTIFKASDFIRVQILKQIYVKNTFHYGNDGLAFYNKNKQFISGYTTRTSSSNRWVLLDVPKNTEYIRLSSFQNETIEVYPILEIERINDKFANLDNEIDIFKSNIEDLQQQPNLNLSDIKNGDIQFLTSSLRNLKSSYFTDRVEIISPNELKWTMNGNPGNSWIYLKNPIIPISWSKNLDISFTIKRDTNSTLSHTTLWVSNGGGGYIEGKQDNLKTFPVTDEYITYTYSIDPSYYTVYKDPAWNKFNFWLTGPYKPNNEIIYLSNFAVSQRIDGVTYQYINGKNVEELFSSVDLNIKDLKENTITDVSTTDNKLTAPNGNKYELSVGIDGVINTCSVIPNKSCFFGNSLIAGSGYGMAASDENHDYYYLINSYINTLNSSYTSKRIQGAVFESSVSDETITQNINTLLSNLDGDEDLVSIQLGDNVNTPEKNAVFAKSSLELCKSIRTKCPKARVVWMGMWYGSESKYQAIEDSCNQTGCHYITFKDIIGSDANSKIGNIQRKTSAQRTLNNVKNVTENSNSNITVTFTVDNKDYTSTLDISSYTLTDTILKYTSEYEIIVSGGVASHPGDEGFRRIANKFLYEMDLVDNKEFYSKEDLGIE